ncbi:ExbD/TolR family protein [Methylobacterium persicinum]|uniref:Biopolymer transport protein TolR n=1 Tax=Methylobacterium persicinum TaxID=374426 RepID=A0ABU0HJS4_9HYPH|nr:ExbD/TolR family protein [Methylobacterium persicinum]MDQ0442560.1 biopolymer transport protein TolR [Methylobacterium persicinum]GJE37768.1 Biopolymer transport protein ExbD [Methylobacterium persicinum]
MAMGSIRSGDAGGDEDGLDEAPMADINVTPMVDVMLVLLIIFMVAAPLMTTGVPVQLPKTSAPKVAQAKKPLEITVDKDGNPSIAKEVFTMDSIVPRLREMAAENKDQVMLVRGDRDVPYGKVMEVMGLVGQAGFSKVSLIAQSPGGPSATPSPPTQAPANAAP